MRRYSSTTIKIVAPRLRRAAQWTVERTNTPKNQFNVFLRVHELAALAYRQRLLPRDLARSTGEGVLTAIALAAPPVPGTVVRGFLSDLPRDWERTIEAALRYSPRSNTGNTGNTGSNVRIHPARAR